MPSSRHGWVALAKQSSKGTPATVAQHKFYFREAPSFGPVKDIARLPRTDSGRDQGKAFTSGLRAEGDLPIGLYPQACAWMFAAQLGANADSSTLVAPTLTTSLTGTNNDLLFTAKYGGSIAHAITVQFIDPAAASQSLAVTVVDGTRIRVSLATNGSSVITSTAAQVKTAIDAHAVASRLVTVANAPANDGTGVVTALAETALSGGSGTASHVATPSSDAQWWTIWMMRGNEIFERFTDCKIDTLTLSSTAGNEVGVTLGVMGMTAEWIENAAVTALVAVDEYGLPYLHMSAADQIKIESTALPFDAIEIVLANGLSVYQADKLSLSDIDPGGRTISLSGGIRFKDELTEPKYREFEYGSDAGTAHSGVLTEKAFQITYVSGSFSLKIELPEIRYAAIPVTPDPSGDPISIALEAEVEKPFNGNIVTVTTVDAYATATT